MQLTLPALGQCFLFNLSVLIFFFLSIFKKKKMLRLEALLLVFQLFPYFIKILRIFELIIEIIKVKKCFTIKLVLITTFYVIYITELFLLFFDWLVRVFVFHHFL